MASPDKKKKVKGFKEFDPSKYIETQPVLDEAKKGTVVVAWGRMNPMTAGHEKLVKKVLSVAKAEKGQPEIYLTHSFDKKKNPLAYDDKIKLAQKAFGPTIKKSNAKTIFQLMAQLNTKYNKVVLIAGSDRVNEFSNTLQKYNGKEYNFDEIKVVSAGQRDEEADDVSGISGTKMRGYAATDMKKFTANLPTRLKADAESIAALVRKGMNMSESEEIYFDDNEVMDEALNRQQRRARSIAFKRARFKIKRGREKAKRKVASMDVLKKRARKAALGVLKQKFAKNRRYAELSSGEKEIIDKRVEKINKKRIEAIARKLLPQVRTKERERLKAMHAKRNESFEMNEACQTDTQVRKRPHMLLNKEGKVKFDTRFKLYKKKVNESVEDLYEDINDLMEATEAFAEWVCGNCNCEPCTCGEINEAKDTHKTKDGRTAKKGLWYNIHQKRKRGEKPAKPGDKDYPETLDIGEDLQKDLQREKEIQARNKARTATAKTEVDREKVTNQLHKNTLKRSMDRAKHYADRRKLSGLAKEEVEFNESAAAAAAKMMIDRDDEDRRRQTRRWDAEDAAKKSSASKKQTSKPETAAERKARRHAADQVHFGEVATHHRTKAAEHEKMAKEHDKKTKGISGKLFGGKHKEAAKLNNAAAQAHHKAAEVADKVHKSAGGKKTSYSSQDAYHKHNDAAIRASGDAHTHKITKMRESVELDEVLDTPKAMDSYKNKAKYSKDRAANSAAAKMLRNKNGFHSTDTSQELKTMDKRTKGLKMADKNAMKKTFKALRKEQKELDELSMSVKDITKSGNGKMIRAMKKDKLKKELEDLKNRLNKNEEHGAGEEGTDKLVNKYKKDTPNA